MLRKHIIVEPYLGDTRFDRCILLAEKLPGRLDSPSLPREWRRPDFLLLARLRQRCLWLTIRSGATSAARVCILVQQQHLQQ